MTSVARGEFNAGRAANTLIANPAFVWVLVAVLAGGAALWLVPALWEGIKKAFGGLEKGANAAVDKQLGALGTIFGQSDQNPTTRGTALAPSNLKGVFSADKGDRELSDLYDATFGRVFN